MEWLFFLYPVTLAVNRTAHEVVSILILFVSCYCLATRARDLKSGMVRIRRLWIVALCLPLLLVVIQHVSLVPPLALRDFDDLSRFFLCVPVYLALLIVRPDIRLFLWGCVFFTLYSVLLMIWHVHVLELSRDIAPNGFLATIPQTSLSIILGLLAVTGLSGAAHGTFQKRVLPALILCAALSVPLLSQTRSGLLLALVMGVLVWILLPDRNIKLLACMGGVAIVFIMIVSVNSPLWTRQDKTLAEIAQYSTADHVALTSATIRIELWKSAGRMFLEHPVTGVGNHRFRENLSSYKTLGKVPADLGPFSHPHDEFLKFAAEGGLLGILSLAMLYFVPLGAAWRSYRKKPSSANPALLVIIVSSGFLVAGLVDVILAWRSTIMFYGLAISLLLMEMDRNNRGEPA